VFEQSEGYARLRETYTSAAPDSFGLFLGAGVNLPAGRIKTHYATYTWSELLEALYIRNRGCFTDSFATLRAQHGYDWPRLAQTLIQEISNVRGLDEKRTVKYLVKQLDQIIYSDIPRGDKYRRLAKSFLDQAPTLHAAICFTAQIRKRNRHTWTFERNPKIGTVITINYDFFFGAGWTRYQSFDEHWKVQTPFSHTEPTGTQKPVYYLHGYIPYQPGAKKKIVLRQKEYTEFYAADGFARQGLTRVAQDQHLIFLGTSFADQDVRDILKNARGDNPRQHFAIVTRDLADDVRKLGVCPVEVNNYSEIARVLEKVYCAARPGETRQSLGLGNPQEYWERLKLGPSGGSVRV
jgi:hypothetical protein